MRFLFSRIFRFLLIVYVFAIAYLWGRPIDAQLNRPVVTHHMPDTSVRFHSDETFVDAQGNRVVRQEIWDRVFGLIRGAQHMVYVDMFLFNDFASSSLTGTGTRPLSEELTSVLLEKRNNDPHVPIAVVTDPINTVYGGATSRHIDRLRQSGVLVIETDLTQLRDSNLLWSAGWRICCMVFTNDTQPGIMPHPFDAAAPHVTTRSWLTLLNFKANHRKLLVADEPIMDKGKLIRSDVVSIISSANPHDASAAHGNVALEVRGNIWNDILAQEATVARISGAGLPNFTRDIAATTATGSLRVSYLVDRQIRDEALRLIMSSQKGDEIDMVMFYLSERAIVRELADASQRGVRIRLILDPNKDAFGHTKNGIPNRPVAKELTSRSHGNIQIRWCDTHGEQCHAKLLIGKTASSTFLLAGSANFTRRNIGGYNLEADVLVESPEPFTAWTDAHAYMERLWVNEGGVSTTDYETYQDTVFGKGSLYRLMEWTGISSF